MKTDKLLHLIQQKKAMRSGGALPLPKAQVGYVADSREFLKNWYDSPQYKEMLAASLSNEKNPTKAFKIIDEDRRYGLDTPVKSINNLRSKAGAFGLNDPSTGQVLVDRQFIEQNPNLASSLVSHELSHNSAMPKSDIAKIKSFTPSYNPKIHNLPGMVNDPKENYDAITDPEEVRAMLYGLRNLAQKNNIYNPFTQSAPQDSLEKLSLLFQGTEGSKSYDQLKRLRAYYTDEQILNMLNTISDNTTRPSDINMAKLGGLPKAQDAGSVDFRLGPTVAKANALAQQNPFPVTLPNTAVQYIDFPDNRVTDPVVKGKLLESTRKAPLYDVPREDLNKIIQQANEVGVDPATLVTIIVNETKGGRTDENLGHALYHRTPTVEGLDDFSLYANLAAQALKEQLRLGKLRYPEGPSYKQLQSYQGYGPLYPSTEKDYYGHENSAFFGIPVTKEKPLLTNKLFPYGKTIEQYRDSVIIPSLDKYGINYKQQGGPLSKAQEGLQWVPSESGTSGNYYDPSTGQYIPQVYLPDLNVEADRELPFQNGKFAPFLASRGMVENDALSDPIAMAAALTAGGVGLGATALSQVPRVFARNVASEATAGLSDFIRNKLAKTASQLDLEELRRVYHNSERFLQPDEAKYLFKHGHGLREDYITDRPGYFDWGTDRWNAASQPSPLPSSEQLPPPPADIWGVAEGPSTSASTFNLNLLETSGKPKKVTNKSGLTKDEVLQKVAGKDKNAVSEMSEVEFQSTVLKPDGQIVEYKPGPSINEMKYDPDAKKMVLKDQTILSDQEYADTFNSQLDLLNDIIAQKNKTGVEYRVKHLNPQGSIVFETPSMPGAKRTWSVNINPGKWRGEVQDIPNTEYFRSVPGLEMRNTSTSVFGDMQPRRGSGTYEAINEYLKRLDLGRVKPGFNSQTNFSRGAWENFIKSGRGFGFYSDPATVHGIMKTIVPAAIGVGALQQIDEKQIGGLTMNSYQKGGGIKDMVVSEIWEKVTGTKWSQAKKLGLSDGSYETNLKLREMLINEAMQPKPNFGKFIGKPSSTVPASSAMVNQLRQEGLAQAAAPRDKTGVARPMMSPVVGPVAPKAPSKSVPLQKIVMPTNQTAPANTSAVARPAMAPITGRVQPAAPRSVATQPVVMPTNAAAPASTTAVRQPVMSPVVGRVDVVPAKAPVLSDDSNFLNDVKQTFQNQAVNAVSNLYSGVDAGLNVFPSAVGNYARGLAGFPITERNFTDAELRAFGRAIAQGKEKGYGVPESQKQLGYTGSFGYDEYPGGRDALNAFTGLTSPEYWGDGKGMSRIKRIVDGWDALNSQYSVGMGNFKQNPDGSWTVGDRYNFNREFVKDEPTSLPEWFERKGYGAGADAQTQIRIPAEYVKQKGGSKKSLKIKIRK